MGNLLRTALRNLSRQKRRTVLLSGAIAFGVMIVTVINGFAGSFLENVTQNFGQLLAGHIFVEGVERTGPGEEIQIIRDDEELLAAIERSGIDTRFITRRSDVRGTLVFGGRTASQQIVGADWNVESALTERIILEEGDFDAVRNGNGLIVGRPTADLLRLEVGDPVLVRLRTVTGQQNVGEFRIAGISFDPGFVAGLTAYADRGYINELIQIERQEYQQLGILLSTLTEIDESADLLFDEIAAELDVFERGTEEEDANPISALFEQARTEEWEGVRYRLYTLNEVVSDAQQIVIVLNQVSIVVLIVLLAIIMIGITNTFRMVMFERIREIGTMRALGMQKPQVLQLFLAEALMLAVIGVVSGLAAAALVMTLLSQIYIGIDTPIFVLLNDGYFTFRVRFWQAVLHTSLVVLFTVMAAWFPARRASQLPPVEALRSTH